MLQTMNWGFQWSKENEKSQNAINARTETILEGVGVWNKMRGKKRCVVLCQGYYEWLKKGKDKLPHFTQHSDGKIMLLAGLYDSVAVEGESGPLCKFAVVTTDASKELSWLHDRQPLILTSQEEIDSWLDTSSQSWNPKLKAMMRPYHDQEAPLKCYQVPKEVGRVGAESATYIQPLSNRKDGIQAMFARQRLKQDPKQTKPSEVVHSRRKRSPSPTLADDGIQIVKKEKKGMNKR